MLHHPRRLEPGRQNDQIDLVAAAVPPVAARLLVVIFAQNKPTQFPLGAGTLRGLSALRQVVNDGADEPHVLRTIYEAKQLLSDCFPASVERSFSCCSRLLTLMRSM